MSTGSSDVTEAARNFEHSSGQWSGALFANNLTGNFNPLLLHLYTMGGSGPKTYLGWWGAMGGPAQKNVAVYSVSPYATKPLKGNLHNAFFNTFRRTKNQIAYIVLPGIIVWNIWAKARDYNEYLYTKAGREDLEKANA